MTKKEKMQGVIDALENNNLKSSDLSLLWKLSSAVKKAQEKVKKEMIDCFDITETNRFKEWSDHNLIVDKLTKKGYALEEFCQVIPPNKLEKSITEKDFDEISNLAVFELSQRKTLKKEYK